MGNRILIILLSLTLYSCLGKERYTKHLKISLSTKNEMQNQGKKTDTLKLSKNVDSVKIVCLFFGKYREKALTLYFSNNNIKGAFHHKDKKIFTINSLNKKNKLIYYINEFYIEESESIVYSKKPGPVPVTDYPFIQVQAFKDGKEIFKQETTLYNNIGFNPKFLEFYELLEELIAKKSK